MEYFFAAVLHFLGLLEPVPSPVLPIPTPIIASITPSITPSPTVTLTPTPSKKPTPKPIQNSLLRAVNSFRVESGKPQLSSHQLLCTIAQQRLSSLITRGSLDNHEGYPAYASQLSDSFTQWWETLFYGEPQRSSDEVVRSHWSNSSGHKASLLSDATHGCGAEKNGFAVFQLGRK